MVVVVLIIAVQKKKRNFESCNAFHGEEIKLFLKHDEPRILDEVSSSPEWKLIEVSAFKLLWGSAFSFSLTIVSQRKTGISSVLRAIV